MRGSRLLWLGIPVLNTLFQIFVKLAADEVRLSGSGNEWLVRSLMSPWMLGAITIEIACFIVWMQVLAELDLSKAFPLSAISYVLVLTSSWLFFHEEITTLRLLGSALILGGVWLIGTASSEHDKGTSRSIPLGHPAANPDEARSIYK
jgi:drug/metabolite transporter (DMT)-like permease